MPERKNSERLNWGMHELWGGCSGLILLRNRGLLDPVDLLPLFFRLFRCPDKVRPAAEVER